jgi:hypothetical protein
MENGRRGTDKKHDGETNSRIYEQEISFVNIVLDWPNLGTGDSRFQFILRSSTVIDYPVLVTRLVLHTEAQLSNTINCVITFDVHEPVHRDMVMNVTNKMQLYRLIYYCWLI